MVDGESAGEEEELNQGLTLARQSVLCWVLSGRSGRSIAPAGTTNPARPEVGWGGGAVPRLMP